MALLHLLSQVFIYLFGLLYPSYHTFHFYYQVKLHPSLYDAEVVQELLHHYVVMSITLPFFWVCDLFVFWLPFYEECKFLFIVWLVLPTTLVSLYFLFHF
ncbi:hypothetical protein HMI55_003444 [Coelomomyces lativittatus]|nr:hypothetical protein HMI55_003444 [Coelomomyces lativittatus]